MAAAVSYAGRRLPGAATGAPAWASAVAMAAPRPVAAPVIRAILLSRRKRSRIVCELVGMMLQLYRGAICGSKSGCGAGVVWGGGSEGRATYGGRNLRRAEMVFAFGAKARF